MKETADNYLRDYLKRAHSITIAPGELADFQLTGEEDERTIEGYADDYAQDLATEEAEARAWRKHHGHEDDSPSLDMDLNY